MARPWRLRADHLERRLFPGFVAVALAIVGLTGFDVESLSTLYIDKPMKAHTLMQAIARANRVSSAGDAGGVMP